MKRLLIPVLALLFAACTDNKTPEEWIPWVPDRDKTDTLDISKATRLLAIPDQRGNENGEARVTIVDQPTGKVCWEWDVLADSQLTAAQKEWFVLPDEAKPVYDGTCLLVTASRGGAALIRISDKRILFLAKPAGNPHSAEVLPDGNIVVASSTGNTLKVFVYDEANPYVSKVAQTINAPKAHNVLWDAKRNCLWSAVDNQLIKYTYNNNRTAPALTQAFVYDLPAGNTECHDLAPVYGEDAMYISSVQNVFKFDIASGTFTPQAFFVTKNVKSISSGPEGYPTILMRPTSSSYYSAEIVDIAGNAMYRRTGSWFYKGRWVVDNPFSNPEKKRK